MKFNKPSEKKPPYLEKLILFKQDNTWECGFLNSYIEMQDKKEFKFVNTTGNEIENVIYWGIPKSPSE